MEAKKLVAVFLMCMVVLTAVSVSKVEATEEEYKDCYNTCHQECSQQGQGYTFCEVKCDEDCSRKDFVAQFPKFKA
ncbi:major pollen allergen Ole e 6-like [Lycium barbarum]|uniref:major pollen allergen Ole e 6-like n=1 Tax=Lycium ferocissimum TaxID=112874 RepID=UPI002814E6EA|nr:major pollen allergen Ole e 6-like [Lycium ferocissimum]XP_060197746.1 major pollen allergen Ole e 6-like [Lycium barbarum]